MNEKEKDALIQVKHFNNITRYWQEEEYEEKEIKKYITTILNLIEKQDKIIQAIATKLVEHIGTCPIDYDDDFENEKCERCQNTYEECWIEYFTKKVGE